MGPKEWTKSFRQMSIMYWFTHAFRFNLPCNNCGQFDRLLLTRRLRRFGTLNLKVRLQVFMNDPLPITIM